MKTTVIIPNYNGIEYLKRCLDSLDRVNSRDFDIVVVDNGSTDGSAAWVRDMRKEIKLIALPENTGFAAAVNRGIESTESEYVILLNNDTEVDPDFVDALVNAIESDERIFSVNSKMVTMQDSSIIDGAGDYYCALGWAYAYGKGRNANESCVKRKEIFSACAGAAIYRRELLVKVGMFDEAHFAYLEDVDVGYRARIEGYKNIYEPSAICIHAGSGSSGSRYNEFKINLSSRNSVYIIWKNMMLLQIIINLPFLLVGFLVKTLFFALKGYGITYVRGLGRGVKLCFSKECKHKKIRFKWRNLGHIVLIQLELWLNILRRLCFF